MQKAVAWVACDPNETWQGDRAVWGYVPALRQFTGSLHGGNRATVGNSETMLVNGYRCMWVLVMFDLPTETKAARKAYAKFRKSLLQDGFHRMQFSIYTRHCPSQENADVHIGRVQSRLPPDGEIRVMTITDKQMERMDVFLGKKRQQPEPPPLQLLLF